MHTVTYVGESISSTIRNDSPEIHGKHVHYLWRFMALGYRITFRFEIELIEITEITEDILQRFV